MTQQRPDEDDDAGWLVCERVGVAPTLLRNAPGGVLTSGKDFRARTLTTLKNSLGKLWKSRSVTISEYDPTYKTSYLGNVLTGWAKGEGCVEKPLSTLWRNYTSSNKNDVRMKLSVTQSGLKAVTKEHGLTEYWAHRITYCAAPSAAFPRVFCWVYRHEGRRLKPELRCHAVLCQSAQHAQRIVQQLRDRLHVALLEFKRDKVSRQNARLSLANAVYEHPSLPRRKLLLSTGSHNYRPPLERSKSAPKLTAIEECDEEDEPSTSATSTMTTSSVSTFFPHPPTHHPVPSNLPALFKRSLTFPAPDSPAVAAAAAALNAVQQTPITEEDSLSDDSVESGYADEEDSPASHSE